MLFEWRIRDVEEKANRAENRLHEVDSLRSDVDRLERTLREISTVVDGLRDELVASQEKTERLEQVMNEAEITIE